MIIICGLIHVPYIEWMSKEDNKMNTIPDFLRPEHIKTHQEPDKMELALEKYAAHFGKIDFSTEPYNFDGDNWEEIVNECIEQGKRFKEMIPADDDPFIILCNSPEESPPPDPPGR